MSESHTGRNIANVIKDAIVKWGITTPNPPLVSDNAANMIVAARELSSKPHIGCFAHTLNLAAQKSLKINTVSRILGRVRKLVGFFHRSTTASAVLKAKTNLIGLKQVKLTCDVPTRWNSAADMLQRYVQLQPAIYATLLSPDVKGDCELSVLNEADAKLAEEIVKCLGPLKEITEAVCSESMPTVSAIIPLVQKVRYIMATSEMDTTMARSIKEAVVNDINNRYKSEDILDFLAECTLLDPRFKTTYLNPETLEKTYRRLALLMYSGDVTVKVKVEEGAQALNPGKDDPPLPQLPQMPDADQPTSVIETPDTDTDVEAAIPQQSTKKVGLAAIFDCIIVKEERATKSLVERVNDEIQAYQLIQQISIGHDALEWWKDNCIYFPILATLAKQRLCIPATSVPAERIFSSAGDIVTAQRACLSPEMVDILLFCKKKIVLFRLLIMFIKTIDFHI